MAARTLADGAVVDGTPVSAGGVAHSALCEINIAAHHAHEGECDVVVGHVLFCGAPLHLLHAEDALVVEQVGVGAVEAGGGVEAVIVEEEVVLGSLLADAVGHLDARLVITVEEVNLEALDAHGGVLLASLLELVIKHVEHRPKDNVDALLLSVGDELLEVQFGDDGEHVAALGVVPALVEDNIFDAVLGSEVDVILIGRHVDAGLEGYALEVPGVPPVPRHFAGLDPRRVADAVGRGEGIDKVVQGHLGVVVGDGKHTPGEIPCAIDAADKVLRLSDVQLLARGALAVLLRVRWEDAQEKTPSLLPREGESLAIARGLRASLSPPSMGGVGGGSEEHPRIGLQVALKEGDLSAVDINGGRQEGGDVAGTADGRLVVEVLEGHGEGVALVGGVGEPCRRVAREGEGSLLVAYLQRRLLRVAEAVGHAVVVGADDKREAAVKRQRQFITGGADEGLAPEGGVSLLRHAARARCLQGALHDGAVRQRQADGRGLDEHVAVARDAIGQRCLGGEGDNDAPVGRHEAVGFLAGGVEAQRHQQADNK